LSDDGGAKVTVFFLGSGKRTLDTTIAELDLVTGEAAVNPILDVAAQANWQHAHHNLYVVELKPQVFSWERTFLEANLGYIPGAKPCVFVSLTPEERCENTQQSSTRFVKYGCASARSQHFIVPYALAAVMEVGWRAVARASMEYGSKRF
jgi:hypothetical protein